MIGIKINHHFIIYQFSASRCILPIDAQPDIALLHFGKIIV